MANIRIVSGADIEKVFTLDMAVQAVEQAYLQKANGAGEVWPMVFHEFVHGEADLDIKSGHLTEEGVFGLKLVSWFGANPDKELPALYGTSVLFDLATGAPKALLNAGPITHLRTGAAGAIGAKYLARPDSKHLVMVGCGGLAPYLIAATLYVMPGLEQVTVVNPHHPARAVSALAGITETVKELLSACGEACTADITATEDAAAAISSADVIMTATPAYEPVVQAAWVKPGTHISCVGADMSGKQELESAIFAGARVFGDDMQQCFGVGECELPHQQGILAQLTGEIGAVMQGTLPGRVSAEDVTIFDSTGIALQDLASAAAILQQAGKSGLGTVAAL